MILKSQQVRSLSPEMDPLRMGMGWTVDDLSKPQIMVESTYGNSHPGSGHLNIFVEEAVRGVNDHGGKAARYFATDMCDGMAQGHDGINTRWPTAKPSPTWWKHRPTPPPLTAVCSFPAATRPCPPCS